jgi:translation initiation factor 5B
MAPKKKGNKKQQEEDWEAELGESIPAAGGESPDQESPAAEAEEGEAAGAGGLLAALRKNKNKKQKKGKPMNDFVEGEDASAEANGEADLASKQPEEGTFDEDDVFAGKPKKPIKAAAPVPKEDEDDDSGPRVKTKKEKEREKKEREKQRKKEQVWLL